MAAWKTRQLVKKRPTLGVGRSLEYQSMSIRIVLVGTRHPGNIGSAARAMKVMGLDDLGLVSPAVFPAAEATARAAGAADVLESATVYRDVQSAVADCGLVVGTTARNRGLPWRVSDPRSAASEIARVAESSRVAVLFGSERTGLLNAELAQCQRLVTIPTSTEYASLNLAMAVQIVAYEIWLARGERLAERPRAVPLASATEMDRFYEHLAQVLDEVGFRDRTGEGHLYARLRQFFNRAAPDENEIHILRGILTAVQGRRRRAGDPHGKAPQGSS
jgi:TrmH family RNA methyltransferase